MRSNTEVTNSMKVRCAAAVLGAAAFMPWYSSQAIVARDTYLGNPLPLIDWLVVGAAVAVLIRTQLATAAAAVGLIDVALAGLLMYGDSAEGLQVSIELGFPLAFAASLMLVLFGQRPTRRTRSAPTEGRVGRVRFPKR